MQTQLKITLQDLEHSAALDTRIRAKVAKLEQAFPRLIGCHVVVSEPHRHRQNPRSFAITLNIAFPSGEVVVTRDDRDDVYALVRDAFATAERELEKSLGRRAARGEPHHGLAPATVLANEEFDHQWPLGDSSRWYAKPMEVAMKAKKTRKQTPAIEITAEERYHLINDAAYFRSLQHRGETRHAEDQAESWCEVESEIDGVLKQHHAKP